MDALKQAGGRERATYAPAGMGRGTFRYRRQERVGEPALRECLRELAQWRPRFGSPRLTALVRREMGDVNHQRVERVTGRKDSCCGAGAGSGRAGYPVEAPAGPNQRLAMDFVHDSLLGGRTLQALTIVDQLTRQCPAIEVDASITGQRVVRVLERIRDT